MSHSAGNILTESLHIGDYITLKYVSKGLESTEARSERYLYAEGIILGDLSVSSNLALFDDFVFCVHLQRQYSAAREYSEFLSVCDHSNYQDQRTLQALERGRDEERKLNDRYLLKKMGHPVLFGDTVQLCHVKSGKYLKVMPGELASTERENMKVLLDAEGDQYSWLQIMPRFKIDRSGVQITSETEVCLKVRERANEFIHCASRKLTADSDAEVNCSLESTFWYLNIFQSVKHSIDQRIVMKSELVYFSDPESKCVLSIPRHHVETQVSIDPDDLHGVSELQRTFHDDTVVLQPESHSVDSSCLWYIDAMQMMTGGPVHWKSELVRIRHLNTGLYLMMQHHQDMSLSQFSQSVGISGEGKGEGDNGGGYSPDISFFAPAEAYYSTTTDPTLPETLFNISELHSVATLLRNSRPVQFSQDGIWCHRGKLRNGFYSLRGSLERDTALSFILKRYVQEDRKDVAKPIAVSTGVNHDTGTGNTSTGSGAAAAVESVSSHGASGSTTGAQQPLDVFTGIAARNYFRKYLSLMSTSNLLSLANMGNSRSNPTERLPSEGSRELTNDDFTFFNTLIRSTIYFSQGFPVSAVNINLEVEKGKSRVRRRRQDILCEQGLLEAVMMIIGNLVPLTGRLEDILSRFRDTKGSVTVDEETLLRMATFVSKHCFKLVFYCIRDNFRSQLYVADFMQFFLAHLGSQPMAADCLTEMLRENIELHETKVNAREISLFMEKLRTTRVNATYLQILRACCSCQDEGVDSNQCRIANMLFKTAKEALMELRINNSKTPTKAAPPLSKKSPSQLSRAFSVRGIGSLANLNSPSKAKLLSPSNKDDESAVLVLSWNLATALNELSTKSSSSSATITDLFSKTSSALAIANRINNTEKVDPKVSVAKYFIEQLLLAAELCKDRNYVSMAYFMPMYPYDTLLKLLRQDVVDDLKAATVRLLLCMHVDRDPQVAVRIPVLTRAWNDVKKDKDKERGEGTQLQVSVPSAGDDDETSFEYIQEVVSFQIASMVGQLNWTSMSLRVLEMLRALVMFGYYRDEEKVRDMTAQLLAALDRRKVNVVEEEDEEELKGHFLSAKHKSFVVRTLHRTGITSFSFTNTLVFFESKYMAYFMGAFAVATLIIDIYESYAHIELKPGSWYFAVEIASIAVFVVDLVGRGLFHIFIRKEFKPFSRDILNWFDAIVILATALYVALPSGTSLGVFKALRLFRLLRLLKLLRISDEPMRQNAVVEKPQWKPPERYSKSPRHELRTLEEIVATMMLLEREIQDKSISALLKGFRDHADGSDKRHPAQIFDRALSETGSLSLGGTTFDAVLLDLLLYEHSSLVQLCLELIITRYSLIETTLQNAKGVQLVVTGRDEKQLRLVSSMLVELERKAETHELWGELETAEDRKSHERTKDIMVELAKLCRVPRTVLEFGEKFEPFPYMQDMLRNLGCFDICLKVLKLLDSIDEDSDGDDDEEGGEVDETSVSDKNDFAANIHELCKICCELLFWLIVDNPVNQELAFEKLEYFFSILGSDLGADVVVRAIFKSNESLMRRISKHQLEAARDMLLTEENRHKPQYLSVFSAITSCGEWGIQQNQIEVVKILTAPGHLDKLSLYLVPTTDPEYKEKRALMTPFIARKNVTMEELPPKLAYHLKFIEVLSNATAGRLDVSTIEAKVQSVFNFADVIQSILDHDTILLAKIVMALYFYNSYLDVETTFPGLEGSSAVWRLLESFVSALEKGKDNLIRASEKGWLHEDVSQQAVEYALVCTMIITCFFSRYFDASTYRPEISRWSLRELLTFLTTRLQAIDQLNSPVLSQAQKRSVTTALEVLRRSSPESIKNTLKRSVGSQKSAIPRGMGSITVTPSASSKGAITDEDIEGKYRLFLASIEGDKDILARAAADKMQFLLKVDDRKLEDPQIEALLRRLILHIRSCIVSNFDDSKTMNRRYVPTTIWLLRSFRFMIEARWGMTIEERNDKGGKKQDIASAQLVQMLNACGAATLCIDLISTGMEASVQLEAVKLAIALLFQEGGNEEVQSTIYDALSRPESTSFFHQVRQTIHQLINERKKTGGTTTTGAVGGGGAVVGGVSTSPLPASGKVGEAAFTMDENIIYLRFLQLLCEGHFSSNQNIMREQPANQVSYNLLADYVDLLTCLSRLPSRASTNAALRTADLILETVQGPCAENQAFLTLHTELIETLNRLLRSKMVDDANLYEEFLLKKTVVHIFQGLLEGQKADGPVGDRILSVVHVEVIVDHARRRKLHSSASRRKSFLFTPPSLKYDKKVSELKAEFQTESLLLLQMLCSHQPSLLEDVDVAETLGDLAESNTASVEILWRDEVHRRFFRVPAICRDLANSSRRQLVENVDRTNLESQLIDFTERAEALYQEVKHQQVLKKLGLVTVFSRRNQDVATWFAFLLALLINLLFLLYYNLDENNQPTYSAGSAQVINALNIIQIGSSTFTFLLVLVVVLPVKYVVKSKDYSGFELVFRTALDPMCLYYGGYLIFSILGVSGKSGGDFFLTFLILDIAVKSSAARDVLYAAIIPWRQLLITMILVIFVAYIYSFFLFVHYRNEFNNDNWGVESGTTPCDTLFHCFQTSLDYGLRANGGIGDSFIYTLGTRYVLDLTYFVVVLVILLNLAGGVIITTFTQLREEKAERLLKTTEFCFICGIEKSVFDRAGVGFANHIHDEHSMWSYLFFIFYLWEQDEDEDDGLEQYVRKAVESKEVNWFPMKKAMALRELVDEEEELHKSLQSHLSTAQKSVSQKLQQFEAEVSIVLEQLTQALKKDHLVPLASNSRPQSAVDVSRAADAVRLALGRPISQEDQSTAPGAAATPHAIPQANLGGGNASSGVAHCKLLDDKEVQVKLVEISNIQLPAEELKSISCRIICECGVYFLPVNAVKGTTLEFDLPFFRICRDAKPHDDRKFRLQIVSGTGNKVDAASDDAANRRASMTSNLIAQLDIDVREVLVADGFLLDKIFPIANQSDYCCLTLLSACGDSF